MASATDRAITRLEAALRLLEAAMERRLEDAGDGDDMAAENQSLSYDRARLAEELDQARAQAAELKARNREASERIEAAMETVTGLIAGPSGNG